MAECNGEGAVFDSSADMTASSSASESCTQACPVLCDDRRDPDPDDLECEKNAAGRATMFFMNESLRTISGLWRLFVRVLDVDDGLVVVVVVCARTEIVRLKGQSQDRFSTDERQVVMRQKSSVNGRRCAFRLFRLLPTTLVRKTRSQIATGRPLGYKSAGMQVTERRYASRHCRL